MYHAGNFVVSVTRSNRKLKIRKWSADLGTGFLVTTTEVESPTEYFEGDTQSAEDGGNTRRCVEK